MLKKPFLLVCCVLLNLTPAQAQSLNLSLSPFYGTGSTSQQSVVQQASGISLNADIPFQLGQWTLGPKLEITNSFFSSKSSISNKQTVSSYDHKIFSTGAILRSPLVKPLKTAFFTSAVYGVGRSESTVTQNTETSFFEYQNQGATITSYSLELGTATQIVNGRFNILFAIASSHYFIDQSNIESSYEGNIENAGNGGLTLTTGTATPEQQELPSAITHNILALRVGIQVSI